jgi:hypothetical protein
VRLRASTDLIVIMSACPQDLLPVNGLEQQPTNVTSACTPQTGRRWLSCQCPLLAAVRPHQHAHGLHKLFSINVF